MTLLFTLNMDDRDKNDNFWGHFDMRNEVTKNLSVDLLDSMVINQVRIQNKNGPNGPFSL